MSQNKKFLSLLKNKGFSLIELMVVVAIIAILSTIAIPSYQTFQAKARQKEGFALMGAYYAAAHASRTEYSQFPGNFVGTGFAPQGTLNYNLTAADNMGFVLPYMQVEDAACINGQAACTCGGNCSMYKEWQMGTAGMAGSVIGWTDPTMGMSSATANAFTIRISGVPTTTGTNPDEYSMDNLKNVTALSDGLK